MVTGCKYRLSLYHRAAIITGRQDLTIDSNFSFFGFTSEDRNVEETTFYKDTYRSNWFVVLSE